MYWSLHNATYPETSNISRTLVGNNIVDHTDIDGYLHSRPNTWFQSIGQKQLQDGTRNI